MHCFGIQADLNSNDMQDGPGSFYGVSSQYCSTENMTITVSTKVCSFGKQVVEKVEVMYSFYCSTFNSNMCNTVDNDMGCLVRSSRWRCITGPKNNLPLRVLDFIFIPK